MFFTEFTQIHARKRDEATVFTEEVATDFYGAGTLCATAEEDG